MKEERNALEAIEEGSSTESRTETVIMGDPATSNSMVDKEMS
jgi:hypothetical protein